ncbi:MAG TPA: hypothetical protein VNX17_11015 [Edaphobacter sp.]|nr:hypothetical protein [Edaphobacter sp.]
MGRGLGLGLMVLLVACSVAHGAQGQPADGRDRWDGVQGLRVNALIEVLPEGQAGPDLCWVSSIDDGVLTCVLERSVNGVRLVFPRSALREVWVIEREHELHIGRWIRIGIEVALFVAGCVGSGVLGGVIVGGIVLGVEEEIAENPIQPRPPRFHRRLIYRASVPASP